MSKPDSKSIESILLQFIAEYHQGLNELAGHGTAIEQATAQLNRLLEEAKLEGRMEENTVGRSYIMRIDSQNPKVVEAYTKMEKRFVEFLELKKDKI